MDRKGGADSGRGGKSIVLTQWKMRGNGNSILHTTGIHKQVGAPKKVRKKGLHLLCFEKGEIGGLTFFSPFFQYPNDRACRTRSFQPGYIVGFRRV